MAKNLSIFSIGSDLPIPGLVRIPYNSKAALDDADIIFWTPNLGSFGKLDGTKAQKYLEASENRELLDQRVHWGHELEQAQQAGKLIVVLLAPPVFAYGYDSNTGDRRKFSSYEILRFIRETKEKYGTEIRYTGKDRLLKDYWNEFGYLHSYSTTISGDFETLFQSKSGTKVVGGILKAKSRGTVLMLPQIDFSPFAFQQQPNGDTIWTTEGDQIGNRIRTHFQSVYSNLRSHTQSTAPPDWTKESEYHIPTIDELQRTVEKITTEISQLREEIRTIESNKDELSVLFDLLYESGRPLETAVRKALSIMGFEVSRFDDGETEIDVIFECEEGIAVGECEGRDSSAINVNKIQQLNRNLDEHFIKLEQDAYAHPVLFGNPYRLTEPHSRNIPFTEKCFITARRMNAALVPTCDMFAPVVYLTENPADEDYARRCRLAILTTKGEQVAFPAPPDSSR